MGQGSGSATEEMARWCAEHPAFEYSSSADEHSVLVRLAPPAHADDIADEVYEDVVTHAHTPSGIEIRHAVVDGRAAIEITVVDHSLERDDLRAVIDWIGTEAERLIDLWHPHLPENGA